MASFSAQPAAQCSAYRPVKYQVETSVVSDAVEKLRIRVYNADGDALLAEYRKDWIVRVGSDPDYSYTFEFDIQGLLQSMLDPLPSARSGAFLDLLTFADYAPNASMRIYVKVAHEYRNSDNLLVAEETELDSNVTTVFNLIQQHEELQGMSDYVAATGRKLLTEMPDYVEIRPEEGFGLAVVANLSIDRIIVTATKTDGTTEEGEATIPIASGGGWTSAHNSKVLVVGIGPRQLYECTTWVGSPIVIDETVASYSVAFANSASSRLTESVTFEVAENCPDQLRLHWLNERGGADAYTVDAVRRDVVEVKSNRAEKPLTWYAGGEVPHDRNQRGRFRLEVNRSDTWEVETRILDEDVATWLAGLLASPEVYVEQPFKTYYLPAMVTDGKIVPSDSEEIGAILKLTIEAANDRIVQRN